MEETDIIICLKKRNKATGLKPRTTQVLNKHTTIWPNWPGNRKRKKKKKQRNKDYKRLKEYQINYHEAKKLKQKFFNFFSFHRIKIEQEVVHFGENSIIKSAFQKSKNRITITKVNT